MVGMRRMPISGECYQRIGHPYVELYEIDGHVHGPMVDPAHHILLKTISKISEEIASK